MIKKPWAWLCKLFHAHDYEMEFIGDTLNWKFVCRCGDTVYDMPTAMRKMTPWWRYW